MVKEFLKIAGVKNQAEFYKKYPSEEAFFKAHPEARNLVNQKMAYGGMYAYNRGGSYPSYQGDINGSTVAPSRGAYMDNEEQYQADMDQYIQNMGAVPSSLVGPPSSGQPLQDGYLATNGQTRPLSEAEKTAYSVGFKAIDPSTSTAPSYQGVSIVDMLASKGKSDFASRKEIAKSLGIKGYKGTADQNLQMISLLNQNPDVLSNYNEVEQPRTSTKKTSSPTKTPVQKTEKQMPSLPNGPNGVYVLPGANYSSDWGSNLQENAGPSISQSSKQNPYANKEGTTAYNDSRTLNKIANDPNSRANINSEKRKDFLKNLAVGTFAPWAAENALMAATTKYLPYGLNALPEVVGASRQASRALPYATRALGYKDGGENDYSGTYSGGVYYQEGGAYVPEYGDNAYGVLPKYGMGAMGVPPAMYGMGMRDGGENSLQKFVNAGYSLDYLEQGGPTYSKVTAYNHQGYVPAFDWLKEGGPTFSKHTGYPHQQYVPALDWLQNGGVPMPADQAMQQQGQQQGPDPQQVMQAVSQMLQQGTEPGQILQELVKAGVPQEMAQQVIQQVMQQMQGAQQQPQQGMMRNGGLVKGSVHDVSEYDVQDLINKGYKIQYL